MLNTSLRSSRTWLMAGTSLLLFAPSAAFAQDSTQPPADQQQPADQQPPADTATAPGDVSAQQPTDEGAIVVTGIRRSLQDSIQIKRNSASVVEAVSAEEIGKLPDVSIAESIARLPGIAAQRRRLSRAQARPE